MTPKNKKLIEEINKIIDEYTTKLTIRQIYYRLVAKHLIENTVSHYQKTVKIVRDGRFDGEIDFERIEDRTREFLGGDEEEESPDNFFENWLGSFQNCYKWFKFPKWKNQENYVEIWVEKQALAGIFQEITDRENVILAPCRGYPSITYLYEGSKRLEEIDKEIFILYFGDYDPSGEDIYRSFQKILKENFGIIANFEKIAITEEQIEKYDIPPMPTKTSDPRSAKYIAERGDVSSVELDAIEPDVLQEIIQNSIKEYFDELIYNDILEEQEKEKAKIGRKVKKVLKK